MESSHTTDQERALLHKLLKKAEHLDSDPNIPYFGFPTRLTVTPNNKHVLRVLDTCEEPLPRDLFVALQDAERAMVSTGPLSTQASAQTQVVGDLPASEKSTPNVKSQGDPATHSDPTIQHDPATQSDPMIQHDPAPQSDPTIQHDPASQTETTTRNQPSHDGSPPTPPSYPCYVEHPSPPVEPAVTNAISVFNTLGKRKRNQEPIASKQVGRLIVKGIPSTTDKDSSAPPPNKRMFTELGHIPTAYEPEMVRVIPTINPKNPYLLNEWPAEIKRRSFAYNMPKPSRRKIGAHIVYWVQGGAIASHGSPCTRVAHNLALRLSLWLHERLRIPLIAICCLPPTLRDHVDMIKSNQAGRISSHFETPGVKPDNLLPVRVNGLLEFRDELRKLGIPMAAFYAKEKDFPSIFAQWSRQRKTHIVFCSESYNPILGKLYKAVSRTLPCPMYSVDSDSVVPTRYLGHAMTQSADRASGEQDQKFSFAELSSFLSTDPWQNRSHVSLIGLQSDMPVATKAVQESLYLRGLASRCSVFVPNSIAKRWDTVDWAFVRQFCSMHPREGAPLKESAARGILQALGQVLAENSADASKLVVTREWDVLELYVRVGLLSPLFANYYLSCVAKTGTPGFETMETDLQVSPQPGPWSDRLFQFDFHAYQAFDLEKTQARAAGEVQGSRPSVASNNSLPNTAENQQQMTAPRPCSSSKPAAKDGKRVSSSTSPRAVGNVSSSTTPTRTEEATPTRTEETTPTRAEEITPTRAEEITTTHKATGATTTPTPSDASMGGQVVVERGVPRWSLRYLQLKHRDLDAVDLGIDREGHDSVLFGDLVRGKTQDRVWNAMMRCMQSENTIPWFMLRYWVRGILRWSPSNSLGFEAVFTVLDSFYVGAYLPGLAPRIDQVVFSPIGQTYPATAQDLKQWMGPAAFTQFLAAHERA